MKVTERAERKRRPILAVTSTYAAAFARQKEKWKAVSLCHTAAYKPMEPCLKQMLFAVAKTVSKAE